MVTEDSDKIIQVAETWKDDTVGLPASNQRLRREEQKALARSHRERVEEQDAERVGE
jgi:hypothetical protein